MGEVLGNSAAMLVPAIAAIVFFALLIKDVADNMHKYGKK